MDGAKWGDEEEEMDIDLGDQDKEFDKEQSFNDKESSLQNNQDESIFIPPN
jgi:hypothetical protein